MARRAPKKFNQPTAANTGTVRPTRSDKPHKIGSRGPSAGRKAIVATEDREDVEVENRIVAPQSMPIAMTLKLNDCRRTLKVQSDAEATARALHRAPLTAITEDGPRNLYFSEDTALESDYLMDQCWSIRRRVAVLGPELPMRRDPQQVSGCHEDDGVFRLDMELDPTMALQPHPPLDTFEPCHCRKCVTSRKRFMNVVQQPGF